MNKKGAIGLPVNILVIIVISLVIFGGAMALLFKLMGGAEEIKATLDQKTEAELRRLLEVESKRVALPLHTAYIYPGDFHSFGLGILNIGDETKEFTINIQLSKAFDNEEKEMFDINAAAWLLYFPGPYSIEENEYEFMPIGVKVPKATPKGTYVFNVIVTDNSGGQYGSTKKFYVAVK